MKMRICKDIIKRRIFIQWLLNDVMQPEAQHRKLDIMNTRQNTSRPNKETQNLPVSDKQNVSVSYSQETRHRVAIA